MAGPYVTIDLEKIAHNARTITRLCARYGIAVTGVTKVTCGLPEVAHAMLRGGVVSVGESRLQNIHRLRASGINTSYMLLRIPPLSEVDDVVRGAARCNGCPLLCCSHHFFDAEFIGYCSNYFRR